MCNLLPSAKL